MHSSMNTLKTTEVYTYLLSELYIWIISQPSNKNNNTENTWPPYSSQYYFKELQLKKMTIKTKLNDLDHRKSYGLITKLPFESPTTPTSLCHNPDFCKTLPMAPCKALISKYFLWLDSQTLKKEGSADCKKCSANCQVPTNKHTRPLFFHKKHGIHS
jgi:hypothetical protein